MLLSPPKFLEGFAFGEKLPVVLLHLGNADFSAQARTAMARQFLAMLNPGTIPDHHQFAYQGEDHYDYFLGIISRVLELADIPLLSAGRITRRDDRSARCVVPTLLYTLVTLSRLAELLNQHLARPANDPQRGELAATVERMFKKLREGGRGKSNPQKLLKAAWEEGIPVVEISGTLIQFGIGRHSAILDSTLTDKTPAMGTQIARDKIMSALAMRRLGLPVPLHALARSEEDAVKHAERFGYPVVVKPVDLDGGVGVMVDLRTADEVRSAYAIVRESSRKVMVERFVRGRDYRMVVFHDRLIWAVERQPGGVTGDGKSSVAALMELANRDPHRGDSPTQPMKWLKLDDEARLVLSREGLTEDSIPEDGHFVRLRRAANVASGGRPIAVFDRVHPDNAALAIQAAASLRLDLAGVDLLLPDIAVSWQDSGGVICEVNAQPQLGGVTSSHLYPLVLKELVGGTGTVPVMAVMGGERAELLSIKLAKGFSRGGAIGRHGVDGVWLDETRLLKGRVPILEAGRFLAAQRSADAIVLGIWDETVLGAGLPLPRVDILALSGEVVAVPKQAQAQSPAAIMTAILDLVAANCERIVVTASRESCSPEVLEALERAGCAYDFMDEAALFEALPSPVS